MKALYIELTLSRVLGTLLLGRVWSEFYHGSTSVLHFGEVESPRLPGSGWVRLRPWLSGICGSDLKMLKLGFSARVLAYSGDFGRIIPGHEVVGEIVEAGPEAAKRGLLPGRLAVLEPFFGCVHKEFHELCPPCSAGAPALCERAADKGTVAGRGIGFAEAVGGGWSEELVARYDQVVPLPDGMDPAVALLADPAACCLHGLLKACPRPTKSPPRRLLVIGAGTLGLLTVFLARVLFPHSSILVVAKYPFQASLATALGASEIIPLREPEITSQVAAHSHGQAVVPLVGLPVLQSGGCDLIVDTIGSRRTVNDALRLAATGGTVVILGSLGTVSFLDLTPVWFREVTLLGSLGYGQETIEGQPCPTFELALSYLRQGPKTTLARLVTHRFPLARYRQALRTALSHGEHQAVKVAFSA